MRLIVALFCLALAGCVGGPRTAAEPPKREIYQKVNVASYAGAASEPGAPAATARGTRYQSGSVSSAAADWSRWPVGTLFRVLATGEIYEVDDFTDDIVGTNTLLLFKPNAPMPGARYVTIEVIRWGSFADSASLLRRQKSSTSKKILAELRQFHPEIK